MLNIQSITVSSYTLYEVKRGRDSSLPTGYRRIASGSREEMIQMQEGLELDTVIIPPVEEKDDGTVVYGRTPADAALFLRGYLGEK